MAATMSIKLKGKPTAFTRFILKWWVLGLLIVPFIRFMPVEWLVSLETEVVS